MWLHFTSTPTNKKEEYHIEVTARSRLEINGDYQTAFDMNVLPNLNHTLVRLFVFILSGIGTTFKL